MVEIEPFWKNYIDGDWVEGGAGRIDVFNPGTGENKLFGEYLVNAQGEDVVAGIRTPKPLWHLTGGQYLSAVQCQCDNILCFGR